MADFLESLKEYMDQVDVQELNISTDQEDFKISSREQANYFLRKILDLKAQKEEIELTAKQELERLNNHVMDWEQKELISLDKGINYFSYLLEEYTKTELENSEKKTIKLPFGSLGFRKQQPKFDYDENAVKEFLKKEHPELLEKVTDYKFSKTEVKKIGVVKDGKLYIDGKEVDGIVITEQDDKFEIK